MSSNPPARKPLKVQPKASARRSKAERDALEKLETERRRQRAEAAAADAAAEAFSRRAEYGLASGFRGGRGGDRGGRNARGGRGGFMGSRIVTRPSLPQPVFLGAKSGTSRGRLGGRSSHGEPFVKRESGVKRDPDGDIAMLGIKRDPEDYGYISSDDDENALGPRVNVDQINHVSEDEEEEHSSGGSSRRAGAARTSSGRQRRTGAFIPIRISRKEHKDRVVGMNTEASSATSAILRKKAEEKSNAERGTTFDEALTSVTRKAAAKVKSKSEDVEIVGKWKGVYDDESSDVTIKQEPIDESNMLLDTLTDAPAATRQFEEINDGDDRQSAEPQAEPETKAGVKAKIKQRKKIHAKPAQYQTAEEVREWNKHQEDLVTIQQELGQINLGPENTQNDQQEGSSDAPETEQTDKKQDAIYLFQFPPIMPDLTEAAVKKEPESPGAERSKKPAAFSSADQPIKLEEDEFGGNDSASRSRKLEVTAGWAGKLRIHKSGRATMTWGGTDMEMKMGVSPYFLQTAILTRMHEEAKNGTGTPAGSSAGEVAGEAIAFGQIRGKLVVTPNWTDILG